MQEKPFYKSKKFVYALATFVAALVLSALPSVAALDPATVDMLNTTLLPVLFIGFSLIAGHSLQDALTTAKGMQLKTLVEAFADLVEATPLDKDD